MVQQLPRWPQGPTVSAFGWLSPASALGRELLKLFQSPSKTLNLIQAGLVGRNLAINLAAIDGVEPFIDPV